MQDLLSTWPAHAGRYLGWPVNSTGTGAAAAVVVALAGCANAPPTAESPGTADGWPLPVVFVTRATSAAPQNAALDLAKSYRLHSTTAPSVAAALARQLSAGGLKIVTMPGADVVDLEIAVSAWLMPPGAVDKKRGGTDVMPALEQVLAASAAAESPSAGMDPKARVAVPLGGWKTPIGQTGLSAGALGFVLQNLGDVTGVRQRFNALFGADATGTVCLSSAKYCARRKGPQMELELQATYGTGDGARTLTSQVLVIQKDANIVQPLAYAIADLRDAAIGKRTPNCQFWATGERIADCEPVASAIGPQDLRAEAAQIVVDAK